MSGCTDTSGNRAASQSRGTAQPGGTSASCPCATENFGPRDVNVRVTQTISGAPPEYSAWNGTYSWRAKWTVTVTRSPCRVLVVVKVKVSGTITEGQKAAWRSAVERKWDSRAKLACNDPRCPQACASGYPITIELQYVDRGEDYTVTANNPTATEGGRSGLGGTTSMTGWGVDDTVDITHEFGHMLGNVDEYFTTNGVDYTRGGTQPGFRAAGGAVMNNPSGAARTANYGTIAQEAQSAIGGGTSCGAQAA